MKFNDYWKIPLNAKTYFSPKMEKELKEKYGIWYIFHIVLAVIILIVPLFLFLILVPKNAFEPATTIGNLLGAVGGIIGIVGSFAVGFGFVNIFMALMKQYLGHYVTLLAIAGGIALDLFAYFLFTFVR